ncbi:heavy metal translocating P-type ATPase [Cyclobacterium marinum]|uniref:P-type Zn(2+) transporter n=1 Tax=Cyclobacterium marinum (strain ATCC 25205 / DSM 745 / LMG 13164 / NCIMB 1802) TaxID=880070 RepID=G0IX36_CYCMS|nr:heavy metal translocating P-type ATPase [Cyclobacterium marinum]AEL25584.1 heavy metal translocating P-type ATPase [Cyclobacterium marinum DSM 745]MBR9776920.1 cadmium-translocating P-type ATPase [Cytophagales bacterium]|tara:strand:+ start:370 stop:2313 length:1944 start_codon:yes stop_codon:yes gene_type:complete
MADKSEERSCCESESCCEVGTKPKNTKQNVWQSPWIPSIFSFIILFVAILAEDKVPFNVFGINGWLFVYLLAYSFVGFPVLNTAWKLIQKGEVFTEFFLMGIATIGAFAIGEYPEGVAVMLFYTIGELLQHGAVSKAKNNIQALLDIRPNQARVIKGGNPYLVKPENVEEGEIIEVRAGEKVPLDAQLLSKGGTFNTAALTGESLPAEIKEGEEVLAGMVNLEDLISLRVLRPFDESSLQKIILTVKEATSKKAKTEQFIRKFAKIYTPIVFYMALALVIIPYFVLEDYAFNDWLYRALVFLVISCPCALVISIPLGYFGGIGAASRKGILFKGSNFLDGITRVNTVLFDKTGTLTKGVFSVEKVETLPNALTDWTVLAASVEANTNHPIGQAIVRHINSKLLPVDSLKEFPGKGLEGQVNNRSILVGNRLLLENQHSLQVPPESDPNKTIIYCAIDGVLCGYFVLADEIKHDAKAAFTSLRKLGIQQLMVLSGDKKEVVKALGKELNADEAFGGMLPEEKYAKIEAIKKDPDKIVAFVGDGINDAPSIAAADVGIGMGGIGSDLAIETADVVIQTDHPSKVALAFEIGKATKRIVWQNISLAFFVKFLVLSLGAAGLAGMWEAVFADVGVALLAVLNAIRINYLFK